MDTGELNNIINQLDLMSLQNIIQLQQNIHSSQVHTKHLPREPTFWVIKQFTINLKGVISYSIFLLLQI